MIKCVALQGVDGSTSLMSALGRAILGLSAAMAVSFHHATWLSMICARSSSDKVMLAGCRTAAPPTICATEPQTLQSRRSRCNRKKERTRYAGISA